MMIKIMKQKINHLVKKRKKINQKKIPKYLIYINLLKFNPISTNFFGVL